MEHFDSRQAKLPSDFQRFPGAQISPTGCSLSSSRLQKRKQSAEFSNEYTQDSRFAHRSDPCTGCRDYDPTALIHAPCAANMIPETPGAHQGLTRRPRLKRHSMEPINRIHANSAGIMNRESESTAPVQRIGSSPHQRISS